MSLEELSLCAVGLANSLAQEAWRWPTSPSSVVLAVDLGERRATLPFT